MNISEYAVSLTTALILIAATNVLIVFVFGGNMLLALGGFVGTLVLFAVAVRSHVDG